jgi:hypothetical protein
MATSVNGPELENRRPRVETSSRRSRHSKNRTPRARLDNETMSDEPMLSPPTKYPRTRRPRCAPHTAESSRPRSVPRRAGAGAAIYPEGASRFGSGKTSNRAAERIRTSTTWSGTERRSIGFWGSGLSSGHERNVAAQAIEPERPAKGAGASG